MVETRGSNVAAGEWIWSDTYREHAKVIERLDLWDSSICGYGFPTGTPSFCCRHRK